MYYHKICLCPHRLEKELYGDEYKLCVVFFWQITFMTHGYSFRCFLFMFLDCALEDISELFRYHFHVLFDMLVSNIQTLICLPSTLGLVLFRFLVHIMTLYYWQNGRLR